MNLFKKVFPRFDEDSEQLKYEYVVAYMLLILADLFIWGFYPILLYKSTGSVTTLFVDKLFFYFFLFVGFLLGSYFLRKIGYLRLYDIIYVGMGFGVMLIVILMDSIHILYPIFASVTGVFRGMMWSVHQSYELKEIHKQQRTKIRTYLAGFQSVLAVIAPILIGWSIYEFDSYRPSFVIASIVYMSLVFFPFRYNKITSEPISKKNFRDIINHKYFKRYVFNSIFKIFADVSLLVVLSITPFLFLKSELKVGLLMGVVGIIAALLTFRQSKVSHKNMEKEGSLSVIMFSIFTLLFAWIWTTPIMVIRNLFSNVPDRLALNVENDMDYRVRENILAKNIEREGIEFNILVETVYTVVRIVGISLILMLIYVGEEFHIEYMFRILLVIGIVSRLISYYFMSRLEADLGD